MEENGAKGLCLFLLFIDTLIFGWPPYFLVRGKNQSLRSIRIRNTIISYLSCFAGGVFLGACLMHLLAEGREVMEEYFSQVGADINFPVFEALIAVGFFAIAIVEQLAHKLLHKSSHVNRHATDKNKSPPNVGISAAKRLSDSSFQKEPNLCADEHVYKISASELNNSCRDSVVSHPNHGSLYKLSSNGTAVAMDKENNVITLTSINGSVSGTRTRNSLDHGHVHMETNLNDPERANPDDHDHNDEVVEMIKTMERNPLRAFLLLGALSFHTVFDGLAVGLQRQHNDIWEMFAAICIHKSLVATSLGLQLFMALRGRPIMAFFWVFVFSLIAPIGVGVGMALSSGNINELVELLIDSILQGIATGTFLYVTIFEILHEELSNNGGVLKILVAILGFGGMAVAKYFDQD